MTATTAIGEPMRNGWRRTALALLGGNVAFTVMLYHVTVIGTPEVAPPVRMAPILVFVTTLAAIGIPLLWWDHGVGYAASALSGAVAIVGIALYLTGAFGGATVGPGPVLYALLGALVVIATVGAWRERAATG